MERERFVRMLEGELDELVQYIPSGVAVDFCLRPRNPSKALRSDKRVQIHMLVPVDSPMSKSKTHGNAPYHVSTSITSFWRTLGEAILESEV
jgi:hypothetical protein